jgi:hypothetical protein
MTAKPHFYGNLMHMRCLLKILLRMNTYIFTSGEKAPF